MVGNKTTLRRLAVYVDKRTNDCLCLAREAKRNMYVYGQVPRPRPVRTGSEARKEDAPGTRPLQSQPQGMHRIYSPLRRIRREPVYDDGKPPAFAASKTLRVQSSCVSATSISIEGVSDTCDAERARRGAASSSGVSGRKRDVVRLR